MRSFISTGSSNSDSTCLKAMWIATRLPVVLRKSIPYTRRHEGELLCRASLVLTEDLVSATSFVVAVEIHHLTSHITEGDEFFAYFSMLPTGIHSSGV